jgi:hypothetical protein
MKTKKRRVTTTPGAPNTCLMPSASCPHPGLHRSLHPSHKAYRQLVPSDTGLGHALEGAQAVPLLIEDHYNLLNDVLKEGLAELEPGNIAVQIFRGRESTAKEGS